MFSSNPLDVLDKLSKGGLPKPFSKTQSGIAEPIVGIILSFVFRGNWMGKTAPFKLIRKWQVTT